MEVQKKPDRGQLAEAIYRRDRDRPRRTTRAPGRWTDEMWRAYAEREADAILAAWPDE